MALLPLAIDLNRHGDPWSQQQLYRCGRVFAKR